MNERRAADPHPDPSFALDLRIERRIGVVIRRTADAVRIQPRCETERADHGVGRWPRMLERDSPVWYDDFGYVAGSRVEGLGTPLGCGTVSSELRIERVVKQRIGSEA